MVFHLMFKYVKIFKYVEKKLMFFLKIYTKYQKDKECS